MVGEEGYFLGLETFRDIILHATKVDVGVDTVSVQGTVLLGQGYH